MTLHLENGKCQIDLTDIVNKFYCENGDYRSGFSVVRYIRKGFRQSMCRIGHVSV